MMDILDAFYSRTYENSINKKMLYYNYNFPKEEVEDYVRQVLNVPIESFIQYDIEAETVEAITPKDVFQFSTLEAGTNHICHALHHANNPGVGMALEKDAGRYKLFTSDVGLFVTLAFRDKNYTENTIYNKLLSDKLEANLGYVYENVVAQMLVAKGNNLFYYTMEGIRLIICMK